jgi:hypothetical protein
VVIEICSCLFLMSQSQSLLELDCNMLLSCNVVVVVLDGMER